jgi:hypothetical protein
MALGLGLAASPALPQAAAQYSDAELKSFAMAAAKVQRINDVYLPKLYGAANEAEKRQVEERATAEMQRALDEEGISADRFKEIVMQAKDDRALADRIREQFKQSQ